MPVLMYVIRFNYYGGEIDYCVYLRVVCNNKITYIKEISLLKITYNKNIIVIFAYYNYQIGYEKYYFRRLYRRTKEIG